MRHFWDGEFPVGDPLRGPAFGERTDPSTIGLTVPAGQGMAAGMSAIGTVFDFIGNMKAGQDARRVGEAQKAAAEFEAGQMAVNAGQARAAAQRQAIEQRRRAALVASRGLAVAAASGAGASDVTVSNIIADIEGEGAYRAGVALYEGEERARLLHLGADARRFEGTVAAAGGRDRQMAYNIAGIGGAVMRGESIYRKYGRGGPKPNGGGGWLDAGTPDFSRFG